MSNGGAGAAMRRPGSNTTRRFRKEAPVSAELPQDVVARQSESLLQAAHRLECTCHLLEHLAELQPPLSPTVHEAIDALRNSARALQKMALAIEPVNRSLS